MRISYQWLGTWVEHGLGAAELGHRLTMAGLELDAIETVAGAFSGVIVARVHSVRPHPDADKLNLCLVDTGSGDPVPVVCGAPNVRAGMLAPFAPVGAVLPNGFAIKAIKLRGAPSEGMLCSARELGLSESHEGLLELPADTPLGADLRELLGLDDQVLEIDLTPNRADCLSVAGVAREVAALLDLPLQLPEIPAVPAACRDVHELRLEAAGDCPRYAGRVIRGLDPSAPTPLWMQECLRRAGIRSLGPLVDVTNYVMLELGQPMHAFDLAMLDGAISVRRARENERLTLLDGRELTLGPDDLVIADQVKCLALAGIMGGESSGVTLQTRDVFLESAHFTPLSVAGRARHHGLHTDSSHRFERGVDPELPARALERATRLLLDIAGGVAGPLTISEHADNLPVRPLIEFRPSRVEHLLGAQVEAHEMCRILERLGCRVDIRPNAWQVVPPSCRFDLAIEVDLIEEIARVRGYESLPSRLPARALAPQPVDESRVPLNGIRQALVGLGYLEIVSFSFVDRTSQESFTPATRMLELANPLSADLAVMRTSLWPGLVKAAQYNLNRQQDRLRLFETGLRFVYQDDELIQEKMLSGLICGSASPTHWSGASRALDFFDLKGDLETLLALGGLNERVVWERGEHPALHPGQTARILLDGECIGHAGALCPELEARFELPHGVFLFELQLAPISRGGVPKFQEQSRFPAIRRDLALVIDAEFPAASLVAHIRAMNEAAVRDLVIFDVYTGKGIPDGRKSVALGLILQDLSSTLTDEKVDGMIHRIVEKLHEDLGATLRV